jgi:hypothetical protein
MSKFTITLPDSIAFSTRAGGKIAALDTTKLTDALVSIIAERGFRIIGMNAYNGGGANASDAEKLASLEKKIAAWGRGEADVVERGDSYFTAWKDEVFVPMCLEQGMTLKQADKLVRDKVAAAFGPDTAAKFSTYIEACAADEVAAGNFPDTTAAREAIEAFYDSQLADRRAKREKASAKIAAPVIDLSAFKKAK